VEHAELMERKKQGKVRAIIQNTVLKRAPSIIRKRKGVKDESE
tara:strand:- start:1431 stop:1559 length:129 start_codon:yes stop_codon:yes gene_type:complete